MEHIEFSLLLENTEALTTPAQRLEVSKHLETCPECTDLEDKLKNFLKFAKQPIVESVPQSLSAQLFNIYQRKAKAETSGLIEKLKAVLVFDDWQFALNERRSFASDRQLLFNADGIELDIRLSFFEDKVNVSGQILSECEKPVSVAIRSESFSTFCLSDEFAEFDLQAIPEGTYDILLEIGSRQIEISQISLHN